MESQEKLALCSHIAKRTSMNILNDINGDVTGDLQVHVDYSYR